MLLAQQPQGCIRPIPALPPRAAKHHSSTRLFETLLSPPTVTTRFEGAFNSNSTMSWTLPDPFDLDSSSPASPTLTFQRVPPTIKANQISSSGLQTLRLANEQQQADPKHDSAQEDDENDAQPRSTAHSTNPKPGPKRQQTHSPSDGLDVFEVQRVSSSNSAGSRQFDKDNLPNNFQPLDLSQANQNPQTPRTPRRDPTFSSSASEQGVNTSRIRPSPTPLQSPARDPRTLFGSPSQETHLPWVRRISNGQFSMTVSPRMLPKDAPPPKSIWDATDDEFDRWPTVVEARAELDTVRLNATTKRGTFVKLEEPELSIAEQIAEAVETPIGGGKRTDDEEKQAILELQDMDCGNPWGRDLHDTIIAPLHEDCTLLPKSAPARHMHVLDAKAYLATTDPVIKAARPRLCDAVATVLAYTNEECLRDFLDPKIEVFEWRRNNNCVLIRREGNRVMVGNYYNFGTMYQWGFLVRSTIDANGAWSETWASVSQGTTPIGENGVLYEDFEGDGKGWDIEPEDEEFALYLGRDLAYFLLRWEVWNYHKWWRYQIEWETDGQVTRARDKNRFPAGLTFD